MCLSSIAEIMSDTQLREVLGELNMLVEFSKEMRQTFGVADKCFCLICLQKAVKDETNRREASRLPGGFTLTP